VQIFFRTITGICAIVLIAAYASGRDVARVSQPRGAVTFLDRSGEPLGTILASDSDDAVSVRLDRVSPDFLAAILAAEDSRYYGHGALDLRGLARAATELFVYGRFRSGGSTVAMQLARLLHPTPSSIRGKLVQIVEAERIAMRSEKHAILEAYVNRVPMGGNLYGVEAAARTYFGTPASDLDLAQAAFLAAVPNDPTALAPDRHLGAARIRARYVLDRMISLREIDSHAAQLALHETMRVARHDSGIVDAAHALFYLYPRVQMAGRVRTTLDRGLQRFVQTQVQVVIDALASRHVSDASALVVDNRTGDVLAYVGSPDYFADASLGRNDGVQALRQPGSSLKPFTYELALERGTITSTSILADTPATFAISGGKLYAPADYSGSFSGPVRVRYALANSLNVPAVRVLSALGTQPLLERLHDLGFIHLDKPASFYGLGLTLGGGEVSLWENVQAYVAIARAGDATSLRLLANDAVSSRAIGDASTWSLVTNMLADPHARVHSFGLHSVLELPFDAAVKTGTSSDFRDTWTIGFSRDYTVGVWVGNFDGTAMHGVSGVTGAGPLWNRIMLRLHERREPPPLPAPIGYVHTSICATTGHAPMRDCRAIVQEWVKPAQLADVRHAIPATPDFHIASPADGSVYYLVPPANALQAREQQLALRATGASHTVAWFANGVPLAKDADGNAFLPLRLGSFQIEARSGTFHALASVRVIAARSGTRPGFSFVTHKSVP